MKKGTKSILIGLIIATAFLFYVMKHDAFNLIPSSICGVQELENRHLLKYLSS